MKIPEFEVSFGKKKKNPLRIYIVGAVLGFAVDMLHRFFKVPQKDLWAIIDQIGREYHIEDIQELVLKSSTLLDGRIERDVDKALKDITPDDPVIDAPTFIDIKEGETPLGGALGYSYDFYKKEEDNES